MATMFERHAPQDQPGRTQRSRWLIAAVLSALLIPVVVALVSFASTTSATPSQSSPGGAASAAAAEAPPPLPTDGTALATFAGGCFWCVEVDFDKVDGVLSTTSGYTGGTVAHPTYQQVSRNRTGHAEVVQVVFDPARVSYERLVAYYWRTIDPTTKDRQFCDVGSPYRTAIYAHDEQQLKVALASRAALEADKPFKEPIVTQIERAGPFYAAEAYHQDYATTNPLRYQYYRKSCGRDARLQQLWGEKPQP
jgi:peptide-methionine (S)-S-oxide reductase